MTRIIAIVAVLAMSGTLALTTAAADDPISTDAMWLPGNAIGCEQETIFTNHGTDGDVDQGATRTNCVLYTEDNMVCIFYTDLHYWHYTDYDRDGSWEKVSDYHDNTGSTCRTL